MTLDLKMKTFPVVFHKDSNAQDHKEEQGLESRSAFLANVRCVCLLLNVSYIDILEMQTNCVTSWGTNTILDEGLLNYYEEPD